MQITSKYRLRGISLIFLIAILLLGWASLRTLQAASNTNFDTFADGTSAESLIIPGISAMSSNPSNSTTVTDLTGVTGITAPFVQNALLNTTTNGTLTINFSAIEGSYTFNYATDNLGDAGTNTFFVEGFRAGLPVFTDSPTNTEPNIFIGTASHSGTSFDRLVIHASTPHWALDNLSTTDVAAGVTFIESNGSTDIVENGGGGTDTDTYQIELNTLPTNTVTITITTPDTHCTATPTPLTFTTANWNTPQTVTVTAVNDSTVNATPYTCQIHHALASSDGNYGGKTADLTAHVTDDDGTPGLIIVESGGSTDTTEGATIDLGFDTYTAALASKPTQPVTITVQPDANCDVGQGPGVSDQAVYQPAEWNVTKVGAGFGVDDKVAQGPHTCVISHTLTSADPNYNFTGPSVTIHVTDNDTASVTITQSGGTTAMTEGGSDTFDINLTSQPAPPSGSVVVTSTPDSAACKLNNAAAGAAVTSTFTNANWNETTGQTITVTAVDDSIAQGTHSCTITETVTSSTDANYNNIPITGSPITVTITDNDTAGVIVDQGGNNATNISESGTTDTYTIVLKSQPASGTVTVTATPASSCKLDGLAAGTASPHTFTTANWNTPQTVTVAAVDDFVAQGAHPCAITHSVTSSSDAAYNPAPITGGSFSANIADNDVVGVTIDQGDGITVNENTGNDTYTIVLTSQPASGTVTVQATPGATCNLGSGGGTAISKTFTTANWNTPQTVTVTAVNDNMAQGAHTCTITHTVSGSTDTAYNTAPISGTPVIANILDDDIPGATLTESSGSTSVAEGGATDTYTAVLNTQPIAGSTGVVLHVAVSPTDNHCTVNTSTLTFTDANWNSPQTITVTAINDGASNPLPYTCTINHSLTGDANNLNYNGATVTGTPIVATVIDNDTAGVTVVESGGSTDIQEGGLNDSYTIVLNTQPASNVLITVDPAPYCNVGAGAGNPTIKTFTTANWNVPQTVTVSAVNGSVVSGHPNCTITHAPSGDTAYSALTIPDVIAHIIIVNPPGAAPTLNYFVTNTPSLTWNAVPGAVRYELQLSTTATFTPTTTTTYQVGNTLFFTFAPMNDGIYYWRVRACTSATVCGAYSPANSFTVAA